MSSHKRSTNERAIARHRLKRSQHTPTDTGSPLIDSDAADNALPVPLGVFGLTTVPLLTAGDGIQTTAPNEPTESVLPPVGPTKLPSVSPPQSLTTTTVFLQPTPSISSTPPSSASTPLTKTISLPISSHAAPLGASPTSVGPGATVSPVSAASNSHGLSQGAVGASVTIIVVFVAAVVAFLVRKRRQRRAAIRRNTWGAGLIPALENKRNTMYTGRSLSGQPLSSPGWVPPHERLANVPMKSEVSQIPATQSVSVVPPPASLYQAGSPLPRSPFPSPSIPVPSLRSVATGVSSIRTSAAELAIVARTFIPSLPDELHIANGEQIQILNAYDDGWALCLNMRGEQGVVPLECLEKVAGAPAGEMQLHPQNEFGHDSNRTSRRMSSLTHKAAGTY